MTASFSQYASRFLNNRVAPGSSLASSQPLFYSFQDSEDGEASTERLKVSIQSRDPLELDEHGEPRLRVDEDLDDPYLRLDEDDDQGTLKDSVPLITSELPGRQGGWLAHQTSPLPSRSPTPPSSPEPPIAPPQQALDPPPTRTALTESLLPRDGISRSVFSLPDPARVPRHKYNDSSWTVLWCTALSICGLAFVLSLFLIKNVPGSTPYTTLTRTVPLLTFLTLLCATLSYIYITLLHYFARPVLIVTALFIPVSLGLSAISAFSGSFIYDSASTWADTIGLRLFSIVPLVMAFFAARSFLWYISQINGTVETVKLATSLLLSNIPVLVVSPALLFAALLATLPFISLVLRLLLLGYRGKSEWSEWHIRPYAIWMAIIVCFIWIWSWCIVRGLLRVTASGAVGAWFFQQGYSVDPMEEQIQATRAALGRAAGPSIGTICKSSLMQALIGSTLFLLRGLRRLTSSPLFPAYLHPISIPIMFLSRVLVPFSFDGYTLPYVGLTGESFQVSSRRAREVTSVKRLRVMPPSYGLLPTLMTLSSLTLSVLLALTSYLFTAHTLSKPAHAAFSALLTGGMTFLASWFCGGIVGDTADALYLCYCIDKESGSEHRKEVYEVFDGPRPAGEV